MLMLIAEEDSAMAAASIFIHMMIFTIGIYYCMPHVRNPSCAEQRLIWSDYENRNIRRGTFRRALRMEKHSFDRLVDMVRLKLSVDRTMAQLRGGPIIPELCVFCTVRYFAGGSYLDIIDICGISVPSFYRVLWRTVRAMNQCPELDINWPKQPAEIYAAASGFQSVGTDGTINNCVGVVDGYLLRTATPRRSEVKNVRSFFSGHYKCYGVNVQAVADHHSRFTYIAMAAPGVTGDRDAIKAVSLYQLVEDLPYGYCVIGDAAYDASEHMVTIFDGADRLNSKYDDFNFYASQLRIRVEMAFGMMQNKWAILQRPVTCRLKNIRLMVQVIGRLHNYCINERLEEHGKDTESASIPKPNGNGTNVAYLPTEPCDGDGNPLVLGHNAHRFTANSVLREYMADRVLKKGLKRPATNKIRK